MVFFLIQIKTQTDKLNKKNWDIANFFTPLL